MAKDKMNAPINEKFFSPPGSRHPAGDRVLLKDATLIAIHAGVTTRRQAGQSGADDYY